jgi:hypothetical protein
VRWTSVRAASNAARASGCGWPCSLSAPTEIKPIGAAARARNAGSEVPAPWWGTASSPVRSGSPRPAATSVSARASRSAWAARSTSPANSATRSRQVARTTREASLRSLSACRYVRPGGGPRTSRWRSPTVAVAGATTSRTGTPWAVAAACNASSDTAGSGVGGAHTAATSARSSTAGAPPMWSRCPWVITSRSRSTCPWRANHLAAASSSPVSTRIRAPGVRSRKASPWPTSMAVTVKVRVGTTRPVTGGSAATTHAPAATAAVHRELLVPGRVTTQTEARTSATAVVGAATDAVPPQPAVAWATARMPRAGTPASPKRTAPADGWTVATTVAGNAIAAVTTANGTATRLAGTLASGTSPKVPSSRGTTATCAPTVTASTSATRRGRRPRRSRTRGAITSTPAAAVADSSSPTEPASSGSTRTSNNTAHARAWRPSRRTPRLAASSTTPATVPARRTDGWNRVRYANQHTTTATATRRVRAPARATPQTPSTPATTVATCIPDTAVRWVVDVASIAARSASCSSRVSPVTRPTSSPPARSPAYRIAASRVRARTTSLERANGPGEPSTVSATGSSTTVRCCCASQRPYPLSGSGRAVAGPRQLVPSAGGDPSCGGASTTSGVRVSAARSRVAVPSTDVTRTGTCHPVAMGRGSAATVSWSSAAPPRAASSGSAPSWCVAVRAPARSAATTTTSATVAAPRRAAAGRRTTTAAAPTTRTAAAAARSGAASRAPPPEAWRAASTPLWRVPTLAPAHAPRTAAHAHGATGPTISPAAGPGGASSSSALPGLTRR